MAKKLNQATIEKAEEDVLLGYLIRLAKSQTRKDIKKAGLPADRKTLRKLERDGRVTKMENFALNTTKKYFNAETKKIETYKGTKYYTYKAI